MPFQPLDPSVCFRRRLHHSLLSPPPLGGPHRHLICPTVGAPGCPPTSWIPLSSFQRSAGPSSPNGKLLRIPKRPLLTTSVTILTQPAAFKLQLSSLAAAPKASATTAPRRTFLPDRSPSSSAHFMARRPARPAQPPQRHTSAAQARLARPDGTGLPPPPSPLLLLWPGGVGGGRRRSSGDPAHLRADGGRRVPPLQPGSLPSLVWTLG